MTVEKLECDAAIFTTTSHENITAELGLDNCLQFTVFCEEN